MPSAHRPQFKRDGGIYGQGGGCPVLGSRNGQICGGTGLKGRGYLPALGSGGRPAWGQGEGRPRAASRRWSVSGYLSSSGSSPLAPRLPAVSRVGVGAGAGPRRPRPERGLQATLPACAPSPPAPSTSSSPGRRSASPRVHLARVPAAAPRAASSEMLRLG